MKTTTIRLAALMGTATLATVASAQLTGDTVNVAVIALPADFSDVYVLTGPGVHTVGSTNILPASNPGVLPSYRFASVISTVGTTRTLTLDITTSTGGALAPAGLKIGGQNLALLSFQLPDVFAGSDRFNDAEKVGFDLRANYSLLGSGGSILRTLPAAYAEYSGGRFDLGATFDTGNDVDIFDPANTGGIITGARFVATYTVVPAPATAMVLGLAGCGICTRRRRARA